MRTPAQGWEDPFYGRQLFPAQGWGPEYITSTADQFGMVLPPSTPGERFLNSQLAMQQEQTSRLTAAIDRFSLNDQLRAQNEGRLGEALNNATQATLLALANIPGQRGLASGVAVSSNGGELVLRVSFFSPCTSPASSVAHIFFFF
jgi:hypothetical protein